MVSIKPSGSLMAYDDFMHGIGHLTDREDKNAF
jgi:hypothetical protein